MSLTEPKRDEDLSRAWRAASHDDPPAALDDAIRAAARRAVHARPQTAKNPWLPRWGSPIAAAAVVMLAVSVLFVAVDERPEIAPPALQVILPAGTPPTALAPLPESAPAEVRKRAAVAPTTAGRIEAKRPVETATIKAEAVPTPSKAAAQEASSAISSNVGIDARRDAAAPGRDSANVVAQGSLAKPAPVPAPAAVAPASPLATPASPPQFAADQMAERARDEAVQMNRESKRMLAKSAALASGAAATQERRQGVNKSDASAPIVSTQSVAPSAYAPQAAALPQEPNAWLKRIEELRVQGKLKEAREALVRFRKQYPNIELPKALAEMASE